ncbi:MAG: hypothetical protein JSS96_13335 [Bacteroidetes bacterium]|nr:hypothetical protein [Bacteroidota bacterium]
MKIDLKILITLTLPFLAVCGGLYNIAFWGTFKLNGLEFLDLSMLIRSFLYPFLSYMGSYIIGGIVSALITSNKFDYSNSENTNFAQIYNSKWGLGIATTIWMGLSYLFYNYGTVLRWYIWAAITGIPIALFLYHQGIFKAAFTSNKIRLTFWFATMLVFTFSFAMGKYNGELIKDNYTYKYLADDSVTAMLKLSNKDTVKLIGITDQKIILTDKKNERIFIIRSEKIDVLSLREHNYFKEQSFDRKLPF